MALPRRTNLLGRQKEDKILGLRMEVQLERLGTVGTRSYFVKTRTILQKLEQAYANVKKLHKSFKTFEKVQNTCKTRDGRCG